MASSEMVERVALTLKRAIGAALDATPLPQPRPNPTDWSATGGVINLEDVARTVMAAMDEPTGAMIEAVAADFFPRVLPEDRYAVISDCWRAMLSAARNTPPQPDASLPPPGSATPS